MNRRMFVGSVGAAALGTALPAGLPAGSAGVQAGSSAAPAQKSSSLDERMLRELFEEAVRRSGTIGAQMSIIKGDQQLDFAAGFAHAQRKLPMQTDTLMQIGSVTKVFNAAIVASLAEEGLLDLDAPVREYLARFAVGDPEASRTLTLRQGLSMCSGLDNGPYVYFGGGDDALKRYVENLHSLPQHFAPGKYFGYSNAGTCVAGHVASHVTGKPWETLLRERILHPAGLTQSAALEADVLYQVVSAGHRRSADGKLDIADPTFTMHRSRAPSGACLALSTAHLARFGRLFVNNGRAETGAGVLAPAAIGQMMKPQIEVPNRQYANAWGTGPYMADWDGARVWGHAGGTPTSNSYLHWIPEQRGVIAFIVNTDRTMPAFSSVAFGKITQAAFGVSRPRIDIPQRHERPLNRRRYVGTYDDLRTTMHVTARDGDTLRARIVTKHVIPGLGTYAPEFSVVLSPMGRDRFLLTPEAETDQGLGVSDTAFFGDDGQGRATNVLNYSVFPMRRSDV